MIASNRLPYVVEFRIAEWSEAFPQALERLYQASGVVQIGLKAWQSRTVPRNRVFCYMHPRERGCVVVRHHFDDFEAVNTRLVESGMMLSGVNAFEDPEQRIRRAA